MSGPLADTIRAQRRRARSYKLNGIRVREPNSDTRADTLTAAADRLTVRQARAELVQHALRPALRGTATRRICLDLANGKRPRLERIKAAMIAETGVTSWAAPAAERLLIDGYPPPTDTDRRMLRAIRSRTVEISTLRDWLHS